MADMQEVLERQERETRERMRRRAASKRAQRELDEQLGIAVALLEEENQSRRGARESRGPNVDRYRHSREKLCWKFGTSSRAKMVRFCDAMETLYTRDYLRRPSPKDLQRLLQKAESQGFPGMIDSIDCMHWQWKNCPTAWQEDYENRKGHKSIILEAVAGFDTRVWHAFFEVVGSQNDLNVLGQSPVFNDVLRGEAPNITYEINSTIYQNRKDVERCFGILQARWAIIRGAARLFDKEVLRSIMMTCIILHNMIVEDEYDYDADEVYEPNPIDTPLTQIYEKPVGPNGEPVQREPLVRDGSFMTRMIDRYTEMQLWYIHERRQVDLMEHLW
ncbi:hypothetical protein L3X38_034541 [Prunus dulcis]|uniref:Uncharacterized protein n=1 Tax=Prunus dulcis TaxID=3755 RepID=A0AAD4VJP5_PRUDU|nr:hypothetical protein L3X38_034541 [Prunus dulcis]